MIGSLGPALHHLAVVAATPASVVNRIKNAASLISVALALIAFFTKQRLDRFNEERVEQGAWRDDGTVLQFAIDVAVLVLTLLVLIALWPLVAAAWPPDFGRDGVVRQLLLIATVAFLGLFGTQLAVVVLSACAHNSASRDETKSR